MANFEGLKLFIDSELCSDPLHVVSRREFSDETSFIDIGRRRGEFSKFQVVHLF